MSEKCKIVAELGINHNGDLDVAKKLISAAACGGADAVKLQKRSMDMRCEEHRDMDRIRETVWGPITHLEYRQRLEFEDYEYDEIDAHCKSLGIPWFASVWDEESLDFIQRYDVPFVKIPSALLTDLKLIEKACHTEPVLVLSTGMSSAMQISDACDVGRRNMPVVKPRYLLHCHSAYPAPTEELNLRMIPYLSKLFATWEVGYSGHEWAVEPSVVAVALGAKMIERHITLDKTMWGSDQQASLSVGAFANMVKRIRATEAALGDGRKRVWDSEKAALEKLRPPHLRNTCRNCK